MAYSQEPYQEFTQVLQILKRATISRLSTRAHNSGQVSDFGHLEPALKTARRCEQALRILSPVGIIPTFSTMRMTHFCGAQVRCTISEGLAECSRTRALIGANGPNAGVLFCTSRNWRMK